MKQLFEKDITSTLRGELRERELLSQHTSWRIGGAADYVYIPADVNDLALFLKHLKKDIPLTWLGLGSNTLVRDGGVEGVVVLTQGALAKLEQCDNGLIRAEAGIAAAQLARFSARAGLAGLEFMAGIPGTVGGALVMNAGCFGGETWSHVKQVETINRDGDIITRPASDFKITYRHVERPQAEWFVAGYFDLAAGDKEKSLQSIRDLLERRSNTQPTGTANCGSVFRNPPGTYAGKLIEECGLKGKSLGGASVSEKHANFIINGSEATALDIEKLIYFVQDEVREKTGIALTPEVCIIGRE